MLTKHRSLVKLLAINGTVYPLTVSKEHAPVDLVGLIGLGASIKGSLTASRRTIVDLLRFASRHDIKPTIVKFPMTQEGVQDAIDTLKEGKMRYRGVLVRD